MLTKPIVAFSERCAWRAVYVRGPFGNQLNFSLGFDSGIGCGLPRLYGSVMGRHWSVDVPLLMWPTQERSSWIRRKLYPWQQWLLVRLDGRYKWGAK